MLPRRRLGQLERAAVRGTRDLALRFVDDGGRELRFGGRWDLDEEGWVGDWSADPARGWAAVGPVLVEVNAEQLDVLLWTDPRRRVLLVLGGYGSGKTMVGWMLLLILMLTYPGDWFWIVCPEHKDCRAAFDKGLEKVIPSSWVDEEGTKASDKDRVIALVNGARVEFRSADRPISLRARDVRAVLGDEACDWKPTVYERLRGRLARQKHGWRFLLTTTPDDSLEDLVATIEQPDRKGHIEGKTFKLDSRNNRFGGGAEEFDLLAEILSPREFARQVRGELLPRPGRVFYEFVTEQHVRPVPVKGDVTQRVLGELFEDLDERYGEVPDVAIGAGFYLSASRPMVWTVARIFEMPGTPFGWAVWIVDEIVRHNTTVEVQACEAVDRYGHALAIHDSAVQVIRDVRPVEAMEGAGLICEPAGTYRDKNPPRRESVDIINAALRPQKGTPWLYVAPGCKEVRKTLRKLQWGEGNFFARGQGATDAGNADEALRFLMWKLSPMAAAQMQRRGRREWEDAA